jgi:hypothetical protein
MGAFLDFGRSKFHFLEFYPVARSYRSLYAHFEGGRAVPSIRASLGVLAAVPCSALGGGLFVEALVFGGMPAFCFVVGEGDALPTA